jgi:hypothetical protein
MIGHVARLEEMRNTYGILVENLLEKVQPEDQEGSGRTT